MYSSGSNKHITIVNVAVFATQTDIYFVEDYNKLHKYIAYSVALTINCLVGKVGNSYI